MFHLYCLERIIVRGKLDLFTVFEEVPVKETKSYTTYWQGLDFFNNSVYIRVIINSFIIFMKF
jgi:hypothetical protein